MYEKREDCLNGPERRMHIVQAIREGGTMNATELAYKFDVTPVTMYDDLDTIQRIFPNLNRGKGRYARVRFDDKDAIPKKWTREIKPDYITILEIARDTTEDHEIRDLLTLLIEELDYVRKLKVGEDEDGGDEGKLKREMAYCDGLSANN